jgi:hypothetical protein
VLAGPAPGPAADETTRALGIGADGAGRLDGERGTERVESGVSGAAASGARGVPVTGQREKAKTR